MDTYFHSYCTKKAGLCKAGVVDAYPVTHLDERGMRNSGGAGGRFQKEWDLEKELVRQACPTCTVTTRKSFGIFEDYVPRADCNEIYSQ